MLRLFTLLPWPIMALLAAVLFWMAQDSHRSATQREAEKAEALLQEVPAPVAIDAFTTADVHLANEVHVSAWINPDHNYQLTKTRKGIDTVRRMFVLFGPGDTPDTKIARGIVVLSSDDADAFLAQVFAGADMSDPRLPFLLLGTQVASPDLADMVQDAFQERDLIKDPDFLVIEPYLKGRAAALAPDPDAPMRAATLFGGMGAIFALFAFGKLLAGRQRQAVAPRSLADVVIPSPAGTVTPRLPQGQAHTAQPGQADGMLPTPDRSTAWSPFEAVKAKQLAVGGATIRPQPSDWATAGVKPARSRIGLGAAVRTAKSLFLAALILGGLYLSFGPHAGQLPLGALMTGTDMSEDSSDPFAVGPERAGPERADPKQVPALEVQSGMPVGGDVATDVGPTVPLPQIGDKPPTPQDQVSEDIASGMSPADAIRNAITAEFPDETAATGPVFLRTAKDEPAEEAGWMQRLRDLIPQNWAGMTPAEVSVWVMGGGLWKGPAGIAVLLALGSALAAIAMALARRSRQRAAAQSDPWARISDRLH